MGLVARNKLLRDYKEEPHLKHIMASDPLTFSSLDYVR
jgi:hypothetical protein